MTAASKPSIEIRADARAWYVFSILFAVYVFSSADRQILSILAQDVKRDLDLSDAQIGLLTGPAIAILYGIVSIPVARLADRYHRVRLLAACMGLWSILTGLGGFAANLLQLALSRMGVSTAEGGGVPTSASIMADYFPPSQRPLAFTLYSISGVVGIFVSFAVGGFIATEYGWRVALISLAVPGLVLSLLLLATVREPMRGATDGKAPAGSPQPDLWRSLGIILSDPLFRPVLVGSCLTSFASAGALAWGPTLAMRRFASNTAEVGGYLGGGILLIGAASLLISAMVADWVVRRHGRARLLRIVALVQLPAIPVLGIALTVDNLISALGMLGLFYSMMQIFVTVYWGVASTMPAPLRATTAAVGIVTNLTVATGLAPFVVGGLSDLLSPSLGSAGLAWAMAVLPVAVAISSAAFMRAAAVAQRPAQSMT